MMRGAVEDDTLMFFSGAFCARGIMVVCFVYCVTQIYVCACTLHTPNISACIQTTHTMVHVYPENISRPSRMYVERNVQRHHRMREGTT